MRCWLILVTAALLTAAGEMNLTVAQLEMFIRSAVDLKQPDRQVAEYLHHVKLRDKLDDRTIEELQSLGAGPKTVAALRELGDASASLPTAAPPPPKPVYVPPPPPSSIEQEKIIDQAREYALNYTKQLPNFICVQVTRRDNDPTGTGNSWYHGDTITARLSYNGVENYEVILHNNQPVTNGKDMRQFGGTISQGEFGSMMKEIFEPETHAEFSWDHWGKLRGRKTYVFAYNVEQEYSHWRVEADNAEAIFPAYRGLIYIDEDTKMVVKIVMTPHDMPSTFPIHDITSSLDYDLETIGDQQFMLPLKSVLTSKRDRYMSKNDIEFRLYRKFGTESSIKFETPDPLPEDQTKEKSREDKPQK
jgi:hypothetical protein